MEDVIFAGSSARKASGLAEVDLVLDNSDGTLPVDFDEVAITRRMYRNGESEYLINGTVARRMDVLDILHDSGLGTGTHSIISQGSLDSILQSKPEDRRALIEEAAGVLKHKQRKAKSERKLANTGPAPLARPRRGGGGGPAARALGAQGEKGAHLPGARRAAGRDEPHHRRGRFARAAEGVGRGQGAGGGACRRAGGAKGRHPGGRGRCGGLAGAASASRRWTPATCRGATARRRRPSSDSTPRP